MSVFSDFLITEIFAFFLIFVRLGAAFMLMPGFGELFVNTRVRLILALAISFVLTPMLKMYIPEMPESIALLVVLFIKEVVTGAFIGLLMRVLTSAIHTAATLLATQSGLANALFFDFSQSGQTTAVTNMMSFAGVVLMFAANLHHVMITAIADSYQMLPVHKPVPMQDMVYMLATYLNKAFNIAVRLGSPFMATALITNVGAGVLSRLMPNFQVFFVLMAPQIWVTFIILLICLPTMLLWYLNFVEDGLTTLLVAF